MGRALRSQTLTTMFLNVTHTGQTSLVHGQPSTSKPYRAYELFPDVTPGFANGTESAWQERKVVRKDLLVARRKKHESERSKELDPSENEGTEAVGLTKLEPRDDRSINTETTIHDDKTTSRETFLERLVRKAKKKVSPEKPAYADRGNDLELLQHTRARAEVEEKGCQ